MNIFSQEEAHQYDINWYFADKFNRLCVVASGGGRLPNFIINEQTEFPDISNNDQIHNLVNELPEIYNINRNVRISELITDFKEIIDQNEYFKNFESLARKGFFVYDKTNLNIASDSDYVLVVYPIYDSRSDDFPGGNSVIDIVPKIKKALIDRTNTTFHKKNFEPIDLIKIINNNLIG